MWCCGSTVDSLCISSFCRFLTMTSDFRMISWAQLTSTWSHWNIRGLYVSFDLCLFFSISTPTPNISPFYNLNCLHSASTYWIGNTVSGSCVLQEWACWKKAVCVKRQSLGWGRGSPLSWHLFSWHTPLSQQLCLFLIQSLWYNVVCGLPLVAVFGNPSQTWRVRLYSICILQRSI